MFLRKLLSENNKVFWIITDLCIVIIGVYTAYLIQTYSQSEQVKKEKEEVLASLKVELEIFRNRMPKFASWTDNYYNRIKERQDVVFSGWRYSEPQYSYQILEYAINAQNTEIIDFKLYDELRKIYAAIKQLEYSERSITEVSKKYLSIIPELSVTHPENLSRKTDNLTNLASFKTAIQDRSNDLKRVFETTLVGLDIINDQLRPELRKEIEKSLIIANLGDVESVEEAIKVAKQVFPVFTAEEIREIYEQNKTD